jgi:hypothetical protein
MVENVMGGRMVRSLEIAGIIEVLTCCPKGSLSSEEKYLNTKIYGLI